MKMNGQTIIPKKPVKEKKRELTVAL